MCPPPSSPFDTHLSSSVNSSAVERLPRLSPPCQLIITVSPPSAGPDLDAAEHAFFHVDSHWTPLQPPYEVVGRKDHTLDLLISGHLMAVNMDGLKPAMMPPNIFKTSPLEAPSHPCLL